MGKNLIVPGLYPGTEIIGGLNPPFDPALTGSKSFRPGAEPQDDQIPIKSVLGDRTT